MKIFNLTFLIIIFLYFNAVASGSDTLSYKKYNYLTKYNKTKEYIYDSVLIIKYYYYLDTSGNKILHGIFESYDYNDINKKPYLNTTANYKNGLLNGIRKEYYKNGNVKCIKNYKLDTLLSENSYYLDNKKMHEIYYNHDTSNLTSFFYNQYGNINIKAHFKNGMLEGETIYLNSDGTISFYAIYNKGVIGDSLISYFENGSIHKYDIKKELNKPNVKVFNENGNIVYKETLIDTVQMLTRKIAYYESGKISGEMIVNDQENILKVKFYDENGELLDCGNYYLGNGLLKIYNGNKLKHEIVFKDYMKNGIHIAYSDSIFPAYSVNFINNELFANTYKIYNETKKKFEPAILNANVKDIFSLKLYYKSSIIMPSFPNDNYGMMSFLSKNVSYPVLARENGLEGKVIIEFYIDMFGRLIDAKIMKDTVGGGCGEEALRVVKSMPNWVPGSVDGFPTNFYYTLPITFKLQ